MKVDTITSNEQHVRLEIFEGRLPIDKAGEELLRLERSQREADRERYEGIIAKLREANPKAKAKTKSYWKAQIRKANAILKRAGVK